MLGGMKTRNAQLQEMEMKKERLVARSTLDNTLDNAQVEKQGNPTQNEETAVGSCYCVLYSFVGTHCISHVWS